MARTHAEVNAAIDSLAASIRETEGFADVEPTVWGPNNDLAHIQAILEVDANSDEAYALIHSCGTI